MSIPRIPENWMSDDQLARARTQLLAHDGMLLTLRLAAEERDNPEVAEQIKADEEAASRLLGIILCEQRERREAAARWATHAPHPGLGTLHGLATGEDPR